MSPTLPMTGGCGCGAVRFALDKPPTGAAYCHCTRCQHRSGAGAAASAQIVPGSITVTAGDGELATWSVPDGLDKVFCRRCGSALFAADPAGGQIRIVRMTAFDEDPGVRPALRQYVAYAAPWEPIPDDGLPRHPERRPA